jgi:hypothetical protein
MKKKSAKAVKIMAEILDVLHRNGVDADTPYCLDNFLIDNNGLELMAVVLVGDGIKDEPNEYQKKPIAERIARYSKLPKEKAS